MSRITVIVAATSPDIQAGVISEAIAERPDMALVEVEVSEIGTALESIPGPVPCALVLVGPYDETEDPAARWLAERSDLVVVRVNVPDDVVQIALRDIGLDSLLGTLRSLVERAGATPTERVAQIQLRVVPGPGSAPAMRATQLLRERPLLQAAMEWIHEVLREAVAQHDGGNGLTLPAATVEQALGQAAPGQARHIPAGVTARDAALIGALATAESRAEPLAAASRAFGLTDLEFRLLVLALAPELDLRYQRCMGLLLDDASRRTGTLGLYAGLLGEPSQVRRQLAASGQLARWRLFDTRLAGLPPADEPLRLDPFFAAWLLGESLGLDADPRVRRALRLEPWPGTSLLELDRAPVASLIAQLHSSPDGHWFLFAGSNASDWRALVELDAEARQLPLIRIDAARFGGLDVAELEESGVRLGRMALLSTRALVIDSTGVEAAAQQDDMLRLVLAAVGTSGARRGVICDDAARVVRLLGSARFKLYEGNPLPADARAAVVHAAARKLRIPLGDGAARAIAHQYPLQADGVEHAMRLAQAAPKPHDSVERRFEHFIEACKDVAAEGVTRFADRIDPSFALKDVVLPADQMRQLREIVDSVRLASKVLDEWKFRDRLPYGRGTTALFHGPSGCGKTMSALAVAKELGVGNARKSGVPVLRVELSRLISKFIGDTPKHIDRVFDDARRSGAAILIDEADALLQRRATGPGLDSNDRHSAMEVAYLLQKVEGLHDEGLVILTTNLRQNLEPALLRRLRFVIEFPRPDAAAREEIWRRCLPEGSHLLDDAAFRLLGRKIDVAGGNIRQITLRAAFVAAAAGKKIGLEHVVYASRAELAKLGLPAVALDIPELKAA